MMFAKLILGGIFAAILTSSVSAETVIRPLSRDDAAAVRVAAADARLAAFRVVPRPAHMIRYPAVVETRPADVRPLARNSFLPATRWSFQPGSAVWTRAAMTAITGHGEGLDSLIPRDIDRWCPAYRENSPELRAAFWVGMMSALAKHESTYNPNAVGGPDLWYGLLQIYPDTARRYGCYARTGEALKDPVDNLSCAARIMNVTVSRDNAIAVHDGRWRGVAADWGPMSNRRKLPEMSAWTARQSYCVARDTVRPQMRPTGLNTMLSTLSVPDFAPALRPQVRPAGVQATVSTMNVAADQG
jgi:hypothetical protein